MAAGSVRAASWHDDQGENVRIRVSAPSRQGLKLDKAPKAWRLMRRFCSICARSSVGQSSGFLTHWTQVRVLPGVPSVAPCEPAWGSCCGFFRAIWLVRPRHGTGANAYFDSLLAIWVERNRERDPRFRRPRGIRPCDLKDRTRDLRRGVTSRDCWGNDDATPSTNQSSS